jgi:hypothetical protein
MPDLGYAFPVKASLYEAPQPLQPLLRQESGERKFHPNGIVVALMDDYGADRLSLLQDASYSLEDRAHLAQLLGAFEHELEAWGLASALPVKRRTRPACSKPPRHPVQPLALDSKGVIRFKENPLAAREWEEHKHRMTMEAVQEKSDYFYWALPAVVEAVEAQVLNCYRTQSQLPTSGKFCLVIFWPVWLINFLHRGLV